jgi:hypothetical protein
MSDLHDQLGSAAGTLQVHAAHSFTILGSRYNAPNREAELEADSVLSPDARALLAEVLYASLHCRQPGARAVSADWAGKRELVQRLSGANAGTDIWQWGWVIRGFEADGRIVAERHGIRFWMSRNDFRPPKVPPQIGDSGWVKVPKECWNLLPGFYLALGEAGDADGDGYDRLRIYWHLRLSGAVPLMESLTTTLNRARVPFALKLLADPNFYPRSDSAVLYVSPCAYQQIIPLLAGVYREVRPWLKRSVSVFVKPIAPGLGLAEDPADSASFGQHRSMLLARELTRPEILDARSGPERCRAVMAGLQRAGWDPKRLYLNLGSSDRYPSLVDGEPGVD